MMYMMVYTHLGIAYFVSVVNKLILILDELIDKLLREFFVM